MKACPDKNNKDYIKLQDAFGKGKAQIAFFRKGDGSIPSIKEAEKLLGVEAQYDKKRFEEFLKEQPYTIPTFAQTINETAAKVVKSLKTNANSFIQGVFPRFNDKVFVDGQIVAMKKGQATEGMAFKTISAITQKRAELNQENRIKDEAAKKPMDFWNKEKYNNKVHFIIAMENPKKYDLKQFPQYQKFMDSYRVRMNQVYDILNSYKDLPYLEDFFPHFWEKPQDVEKFFSNSYGGKNPLEGNKSFLKQRFFADIEAGIKAGYRLVTDNPEEIVRLAEMNALRFKMGNDLFNICKEEGWTKYVKTGEKAPEGYSLVNDPMFKRMSAFGKKVSEEDVAMAAEEGKAIKPEAGLAMGAYYLPNEVAKIFNNDLSKGLAGVPIVKDFHKAITNFNNLKNSFQLGLSGFHGVGTSINAGIISWSIGKGKILTGNPKNMVEGARMMAEGFTILPTVIRDYANYKKVIGDYLGGRSSVEVERLIMANMNPIAEKKWSINANYNLKKSLYKLRGGDLKYGFNAAFHLATLPIELAAKPIMEIHVPRVKTMAYLKIVENELSLRPGLTNGEIQLVCQRASASVDDLFGQVNYDNLFWDKIIKDLGFTSVRSLGWTGGTIRAIGGGIADIPESISRTTKGQGPTFRTNYLTGLVTTTGLWGGMLYYMFNGKSPDKLQDYYIIPTGLKNPDGTELSISLPTYMKDAASYTKDVLDAKYGRTLSKKASPFISEAVELLNNQDFFKQPIYDEEDPWYKQGKDLLDYEFKSLAPFGFRKQPGPDQPFFSEQSMLAKIGLTKAPSEFTRTSLEETINEQFVKEWDKSRRTAGYDPEKSAYKKVLQEQAEEGIPFGEMSLEDKQKAGLVDKQGRVIDPKKVKNFMSTARLTKAQRSFKALSSEGQLKVISKLKKEDLDELLTNRRVLKTGQVFEKLRREKPEFFKNKELKNAYEMVTNRPFVETEETPKD